MPVCGPPRIAVLATLATVCAGPATAAPDRDDDVEELVVTADLDSLPDDEMRTVFGFGRSLLDTPRSASTVSDEMMARFNIRDIDELIALAPGSFTQSFFGVAGTLDIRGTTGETYFRGIRRLDNPGNYPTPSAPPSGLTSSAGRLRRFTARRRSAATQFQPEVGAHRGDRGVHRRSHGQRRRGLRLVGRRIATAEVGGRGVLAARTSVIGCMRRPRTPAATTITATSLRRSSRRRSTWTWVPLASSSAACSTSSRAPRTPDGTA